MRQPERPHADRSLQLCASNEVCGKPSGAETYQCLLSPWNSDGPVPGDAGVGDDDVESPEKPLEDTTTEEDSDVLSDVIEDVVAQDAATSSDAGIDSDSGSEEEELDGEGDALPADESDAVSDVEETDEEDGKVEEEADVDSVEDDVVVPDGDSADAEEVGACEDEKQGGTFDEDSLQAKLLTAGIACQDPEEFGSIEHVNCLRAQFMETGIGPDCADCFSNFVLCFFAECGEACADVDTNPEPCVECKDTTTCDESLNECAGLNW